MCYLHINLKNMALEDGNTIIIVSGSNVAPEHSVVLREDLAKALDEKENLWEGSWKTNNEHANNEFPNISDIVKAIKDLYPWITDEDANVVAEKICEKIAKISEKHKKYSRSRPYKEKYRCVPYIEKISGIRIEKTSGIPDKVVVRDKSKKWKKQSD